MDSHIHFGSCGCAEEAKGPLQLHDLYESIKHNEIIALNVKDNAAIPDVIKSWEFRSDMTRRKLESDSDGEIILKIQFESSVKIRALSVCGVTKSHAPKTVRLWFNREDVDFTNCHDIGAHEKIALPFDPMCGMKHTIRNRLATNVHTITILLNEPYTTGEELELAHIALLGYCEGFKRGAVQCNFEINPNLADHKVDKMQEQAGHYSK